jgi:hypothetical protein
MSLGREYDLELCEEIPDGSPGFQTDRIGGQLPEPLSQPPFKNLIGDRFQLFGCHWQVIICFRFATDSLRSRTAIRSPVVAGSTPRSGLFPSDIAPSRNCGHDSLCDPDSRCFFSGAAGDAPARGGRGARPHRAGRAGDVSTQDRTNRGAADRYEWPRGLNLGQKRADGTAERWLQYRRPHSRFEASILRSVPEKESPAGARPRKCDTEPGIEHLAFGQERRERQWSTSAFIHSTRRRRSVISSSNMYSAREALCARTLTGSGKSS